MNASPRPKNCPEFAEGACPEFAEGACPESHRRVFVGLSGGVDSSVAAYLLIKEGYNVVGVHLRCWNEAGCDVREVEDARRVAEHLNIPFYVFDLEKEYRERVVNYMIEGYRSGITPNPDVACNREIKFGLFLERALAMGADYVATGHYVKLGYRVQGLGSSICRFLSRKPYTLYPSGYTLSVASDTNKDQSYFLWTLTQEQLKHCLFPIGGYLKEEVRRIARSAGLPTADKKDSQGICFVGKVTLTDFLARYIPEEKGKVVTADGEKVGEHRGAQFYTIGQRHIGTAYRKGQSAKRDGMTEPYYVSAKDVKNNTITVVQGSGDSKLYCKKIGIADINFINSGDKRFALSPLPVLARVRYRQPLSRAVLAGNILTFEKPQKFVAPGQSAVFYSEKGEMLGGGVIIDAE